MVMEKTSKRTLWVVAFVAILSLANCSVEIAMSIANEHKAGAK